PPDAELFQFLDEARLAVARRRLREMLVRRDGAARQPLTVAHVRQPLPLALLVTGVIAIFLIEPEEAVEHDDRARRMQPDLAARIGDVDAHLVEQRRRHLARDRALPDQLVEAALIGVEMARDLPGLARHVGGTNRLVRFLRVLRGAPVDAGLGRQIARAEFMLDQLARARDRLGGERDAVRAHIGDEADRVAVEIDAFVEPLRDLHRARRAEAELARSFLLQRRCRERRKRIAANLAMLDGSNVEAARRENLAGRGARFVFAVEMEAVELLAVEI